MGCQARAGGHSSPWLEARGLLAAFGDELTDAYACGVTRERRRRGPALEEDLRTVARPEGIRKPERVEARFRSEEHTSELQSRPHLVCRLLLEKKKKKKAKDEGR